MEDVIRPDHFYYQAHQRFAEKVLNLYKAKRTQDINLSFLREFLAENGIAVSDVTNMAVKADAAGSITNVRSYCEKLKTIASWRKAQDKAREILSKDRIYEHDELKQELDFALSELQKINDEQQSFSQIDTMANALTEAVDEIFSTEPVKKLETGITKLDRATGGFLPGELIVIGGRSGMGKTATSISFLDNFLRDGKNILYVSLEMPKKAMVKRLISCVGLVDGMKLRTTDKDGKIRLSDAEVQKVTDAVGFIDTYPGKAFWVDTPQTVEDIKSKARKMKRTEGLDGIIVDYLGIIPATYPQQIRREQVAHSIRYLKAIAKELDIPVIVLAQINRGVESRQDKRPTMADFKETGEIEQEADLALLLYRESYYSPDPHQEADELEIIVGKHRNGATGMVRTCYFPKYTKVANLEMPKQVSTTPNSSNKENKPIKAKSPQQKQKEPKAYEPNPAFLDL